MKRLWIGLTLLLASFLSALDALDGVRSIVPGGGAWRWLPELLLAAAAVAVFARTAQLHRRLLFPRRGMRLLATGLVLHASGLALAAGLVATALQAAGLELGTAWSAVQRHLQGAVLPLLLAGQVLVAFGAFRALTNLVPPAEFAEDF